MSRDRDIREMAERVEPRFRRTVLEMLEVAGRLSDEVEDLDIKFETRRTRFSVNVLGWVYLDVKQPNGSEICDQLDGWREVGEFVEILKDLT